MPKYNLLSSGSTKIAKSNKLSDKYFSRIIYLAPDDLADGDAMTEQSLQEIEEELGEVDEDAIRKSIDDMPENTLSSIDPNAKAPDTVPEGLIEEVDKKRFEEFMELQGKDTVPFSDADRANTLVQVLGNTPQQKCEAKLTVTTY